MSAARVDPGATFRVGPLRADIDLLRADYPDEGKGLTDAAFVRDAWHEGIRAPYIENIFNYVDCPHCGGSGEVPA